MPDRTHVAAFPPSTNELEQIRYALDQAAIVAITDVSGRIKYVNATFCEISKYSRSELIGQDHRLLNSGFHGSEFMRDLWRTIAHGQIWRGEIRNRAKDGSLYWVDTTIVPFLDERGKPWQYMAIRYDITEQMLHEQRLREQAALMTLGEMAAVVAHEVRNPLAGLRSGMQLLATLLPETGEGRDLLGDMIARLDSLNTVVGDLLSFARVRELKRAPVEVSDLLNDMTASLRLDPAMREVRIDVTGTTGLVVSADVDQIRLVLMNLLVNASQAMNGKGHIEIQVTATDDRHAEIVVSDSGSGIPVALRDRVFEPFFTTKARGTGLGLPTARRIAEAHGGSIFVGGGAKGGTAVHLRLPMEPRVS